MKSNMLAHRVLVLAVVSLLALSSGCAGPGAESPEAGTGMPAMPKPQKEHQWLEQLAGEWDSEAYVMMEPDKPPQVCKGSESSRMIGGFWYLGEIRGLVADQPMTGILTIGYDPEKKKYIGTWVDSMNNYLWEYEGTVDPSGKILTLNTEGPAPHAPGSRAKFKEVIELKGPDNKTFSSSMQGEDGKWMTFVTVNSRRKK